MQTRNSLLRGMMAFYVVLLAFLLVGVVFGCGGGGGGSSSGGDGGTPPPPANVPPVANAGSDQQVNEGSVVTLDGTGSTDTPPGSIVSYAWTQIPVPTVTLTGANTATPSFTAPAVTAQTVLTFALTVTDNDGAASTNNVDVTVNLAGFLSLTTSLPPDRVDLTIEGTLDWAHWGRTNIILDRKNGVTPQISTYTEIGNPGGPQQLPNAPVFYSWSDGTPDGNETDTRTGIFFASSGDPIQVGEGFFLTVKADTTPKTLKLYLGGEDAQGTLTVALDGVPSPAPISLVRQGGEFTQVATITFKALSAGDLTVTYVLADEFDTGVDTNLTLQAATLSLAVPAISPPGGVFTDSVDVSLSSAIPGAAIRYTVEGSDPTEQSPLFTGPFSVASSQAPVLVKARVFVGGIGGDVASAEFTVNPSVSGGSLSAFVDAPAATVDLTTEGSLDWAHWGLTTGSSYDRKNVPQQIGTVAPGYVPVNSPGNPQRQPDAPVAYSWSDGTPTVSATDTTTGIFFSSSFGLAVNDGYSLTVPADATQKTLKIYLGGFSAEGTLTAQLSDGSAANATLPISNELSVFTKVVTITFSAGSGSGNLTVSYRLTNDFGNPSNLTLQAATLD